MVIGEAGESLPPKPTPEAFCTRSTFSSQAQQASSRSNSGSLLKLDAYSRFGKTCGTVFDRTADGTLNPCRCSTIHAHGTHRSGHYNTETSRQYFQRNRNTAKLHRDG